MQHVSFYNFANIMRMLLRQTFYKNISEKSFTTVMEWMFKKKKTPVKRQSLKICTNVM